MLLDPDEIKAIREFKGRSAQIMTLLIMASRDAGKLASNRFIEHMAQLRVEEFNMLLPAVREQMAKR